MRYPTTVLVFVCVLCIAVTEVSASPNEQLQRIAGSTAPQAAELASLAKKLQEDIKNIPSAIEKEPAEKDAGEKTETHFQRLEQALADWNRIRSQWNVSVSTDSEDDDTFYVPSGNVLEEITTSVQRRKTLWHLALQAKRADAFPVSRLSGKNLADYGVLAEKTQAAMQYLAAEKMRNANVESWERFLDIQSLIKELDTVEKTASSPFRQVSAAPSIPAYSLITLCDFANAVVSKYHSAKLTKEQQEFLKEPVLAAWKEELQRWTADTVEPDAVLEGLEQYETTGGMTDMKILAKAAKRMAVSKTPEYAEFGKGVLHQHSMPNLKIYISESLVNRHVPKSKPEVASFRDVIQEQSVVGRRQTNTEIEMQFVKDPKRLLIAMSVGVDLATYSRSDAFATQLYNAGSTSVSVLKGVEFTQDGFVFYPCEAHILDHRLRLVGLKTGFDNVPVLSGVFRNVVLDQYRSKSGAARGESQQKILRQVRNRVDWEAEQSFQKINDKYRAFSKYIGDEFDLRIEQQESRTEDDWLLTSWRLKSADTLGSASPAPETPEGSFADLKIHESLVNLFLCQLGLEGKKATVGDFKKELAEKFKQNTLAEEADGDDIVITFDDRNPFIIRFTDNHVELTISIAALRMMRKTHRDFKVIVRYKPLTDASGNTVLERDGYISLVNVRAQLLMRAVFGKIFAVNRTVPLTPEILASDPQFDYLSTGQCRITNGWFAAALTEKKLR